MGQTFPIDAILPELVATLQQSAAVILLAPPGAGKTTRVPLTLLNQPAAPAGSIILLEPRRLAAVHAARWMAHCLGESVGATVGYAIRFDRCISATTRIEVVTEGILTRRLQSDPELAGVSTVIFDEFHERSIHADTALALCREIQENLRPDLRILVMSATLDPAPLSRILGGAPVLTVTVPVHPVELCYLDDVERDAALRTARGVVQAVRETTGDILAFLPGSGEIRRCSDYLAGMLPAGNELEVVPLYGDLPFAEQQRAIQPGSCRRVILATNIAETSLTIEGVRVVVDSGLQRLLHYDAGRGVNRLVTARTSAASATQRAGRAGRLAPGTCYRLWSLQSHSSLLAFTPPEICRTDLTELALQLSLWGVTDPSRLAWVDPPPAGPFIEAQRLLLLLEAVDDDFHITAFGRECASLPLHPRLARMLLLARSAGLGPLAGDLASLLGERDLFRSDRHSPDRPTSTSDIADRLELLAVWRRTGRAPAGTDASSLAAVDRAARQFIKGAADPIAAAAPTDKDLARLLLWAYPDRLARQREPGSDRYLLASGRGGVLSRHAAVRNAPFLIAVNLAAIPGKSDTLIHQAHAISEQQLRSEFAAHLRTVRTVQWDASAERVVAAEEETLWRVRLASRPVPAAASDLRQALLGWLQGADLGTVLPWTASARQLCLRVQLLQRLQPGQWPDYSDAGLLLTLQDWLAPYLEGISSRSKLERINLLAALTARLTWQQQRILDEQAPVRLAVPSGSQLLLEYVADGPPVLAVKLQEMFGLGETPAVGLGRVPVLLHLLSPAGRPIQVTMDLRNFWDLVYPQVKKELKGRYPKHPWPDDPWNAVPTRKTNRALKK